MATDRVWAILHQTRQPSRRITAPAPTHGKRILRDVPLTFNSRTSRHRGRSTRCRRTKEGCAKLDPLWISGADGLRVGPKSSLTQTKLSEHETNRGEAEKSECVSGEIFEILGQAA